MRTQSLGDVLGPLRYLGSCIECRTQFVSRNEAVVVIGHGVHCKPCARKAIEIDLPRLRARLRDVNAELQMSEPPTAISLLRQKQRELENRIAEIVEVIS
jgi:prefoldin subunit 5